MNTRKLNTEVLLWTAFVLILSYLCYLPMFLEKKSIHIPQVFVLFKEKVKLIKKNNNNNN